MTEENEKIIDELNKTIAELVCLSIGNGVHPLMVARILAAHARTTRDCFNMLEGEDVNKQYH